MEFHEARRHGGTKARRRATRQQGNEATKRSCKYAAIRKRDVAQNRVLLKAIVLATPMGFLAIEAGWVVTEVGRQPWIITGVLRLLTSNSETVTSRASVPSSYVCVCDVFAGLAVMSSKLPSPQWMM